MRTTLGRLGLLAASQITVLCCGQETGLVPAVPAQAPRRTVTGMVVNAVSGVPIRHALVQVSGVSPAAVLTGPDGHFRFDNVPEGQAVISAQRPGFFDPRSIPGVFERSADPFVMIGSGENDFRLPLYPVARFYRQDH